MPKNYKIYQRDTPQPNRESSEKEIEGALLEREKKKHFLDLKDLAERKIGETIKWNLKRLFMQLTAKLQP